MAISKKNFEIIIHCIEKCVSLYQQNRNTMTQTNNSIVQNQKFGFKGYKIERCGMSHTQNRANITYEGENIFGGEICINTKMYASDGRLNPYALTDYQIMDILEQYRNNELPFHPKKPNHF